MSDRSCEFMCEFDCEGCGTHVFAFGVDLPPRHLLCSTCAWLNEHVPDPEEMERLHKRLTGEPEA